ncbi:MAG: hypothetical protein ABIP51_18510 [Bacteroidia bacterium]
MKKLLLIFIILNSCTKTTIIKERLKTNLIIDTVKIKTKIVFDTTVINSNTLPNPGGDPDANPINSNDKTTVNPLLNY